MKTKKMLAATSTILVTCGIFIVLGAPGQLELGRTWFEFCRQLAIGAAAIGIGAILERRNNR